jgi:hypothetical protein
VKENEQRKTNEEKMVRIEEKVQIKENDNRTTYDPETMLSMEYHAKRKLITRLIIFCSILIGLAVFILWLTVFS